MTRIKICGITNLDDALKAVEYGADAIGFVFAESARRVDAETARKVSLALPPFISRVGVFVNEYPEIIEQHINRCRLDTVQLYTLDNGVQSHPFHAMVIRTFCVQDRDILDTISRSKCDYFLLDTFNGRQGGGTGRAFDWSIASDAAQLGHLILAGGLNPENVATALATVRPYAVDVSSGVEKSPGLKAHHKMRQFINEVKKWDSRTN